MSQVPTAPSAGRLRLSAADVRERLSGAEIVVPASVANLGPGFDTLALALQLYLHVRVVDVADHEKNGLTFDFGEATLEGDNLIERAFLTMAREQQIEFPSLALRVRTEIPARGGLGSSAAAVVAGLRLFEEAANHRTSDLLTIATRLDHHADNVSASLFGGLTLSCVADDGAVTSRIIEWPREVRCVVATPAMAVATSDSRKVLPDQYSRADAVFNLQRTVLLVHALEHGDFSVVREALRDRWHQPYRMALVPGLREALGLEHPHLLGVCLSGSGPAVVAFATGAFTQIEQQLADIYNRLNLPCAVRTLAAHQPGVA